MPIAPMRLSLSTGCLYCLPLRAVLRRAAEAGFEGVELLIAPEVLGLGPRRVLSLVRQHGLEVSVVHRGLMPIPGWKEHGAGMSRMVAFARAVEAPTVVIHPPRQARAIEDPVMQRFRRLVDAAVKAAGDDVTLAIENLSLKRVEERQRPFSDLTILSVFAEAHGLGLTLDTSHAATFGHDLPDAYRTFRARLRNVHLSDYRPGPAVVNNGLLTNHFVQHQIPGTGVLPLEPLLEAMVADGYAQNVTLEVGPIPMRAWWPPSLRKSLERMADFVRRVRDEG
jgi:sugar phosphate isomerase/epimerase